MSCSPLSATASQDTTHSGAVITVRGRGRISVLEVQRPDADAVEIRARSHAQKVTNAKARRNRHELRISRTASTCPAELVESDRQPLSVRSIRAPGGKHE